MNQQQGAKTSPEAGNPGDVGDNEIGPTEKLREPDKAREDFSVPGTQNPESEEIKNEQSPNTE